MLIDWVSARIELMQLSEADRQALRSWGDRIQRFTPSTGEISYETGAWDSIRSDSHQLTAKVGATDLYIQGSPARLSGNGCAVFGSGPSHALDLTACVDLMARTAAPMLGITLPTWDNGLEDWKVSRIDVTSSFMLDCLADVRSALGVLRGTEGGRYRVSQQAGDTVYWSHKSRLRAGKAYAKGPHLRYMMKKGIAPKEYSSSELLAADKLLRLELRLGAQWIREKADTPWWGISSEVLKKQWFEYFSRMIGDSEVVMGDDKILREQILAAADTEGRGKAAYGVWMAIQVHGWETARQLYSKPTWYRNLKVLRDAGLGDADISIGRVQPLRRSLLECRHVHSWGDLLAA